MFCCFFCFAVFLKECRVSFSPDEQFLKLVLFGAHCKIRPNYTHEPQSGKLCTRLHKKEDPSSLTVTFLFFFLAKSGCSHVT